MKASEALEMMRLLAEGINPFDGEIFEDDSPYQNPQMVRAFYKAIEALETEERREARRKDLPANTGKPWDDREDDRLMAGYDSGSSIKELSIKHKRTIRGIWARLEKLGKIHRMAADN